jgi:amidase
MAINRFRSVASIAVSMALVASMAIGAAGAPARIAARECRPTAGGVNLQKATIVDLQRELTVGKLTSRKLVKTYLARIRAYDPRLNSIRVLNPHALRIAAKLDNERKAGHVRGILHGIPILLKDNVNTTDMPTTAGSIALKGSVPRHEATITKKLKAAGAIILGKTNLSEFAGWVDLNMPPGYSSLGGQVVNPYNFGDPSGSSAGSGVASTMAFAAAAIGTETSGSILSPSNVNSLVGIKPTTGLVSRYGILPLAPSFDTAGPMARNVTDAAIVLSALQGVDPKDPRTSESEGQAAEHEDYTEFLSESALTGARIGFSPDDRDGLSADRQKLFDAALATLEKQGATLVETDKMEGTSNDGLAEIAAIPNEFKYSLNAYLQEETSDDLRVRTLSDIVAYNDEHPKKMKYGQNLLKASDSTAGTNDPATQAQAQASIEAARGSIDGALVADDLDAIVAPGPIYANVSAAAGYPTVMVPQGYAGAGKSPLGLSILSTAYTEPRLIGYAYDYEQASKLRRPATSANELLIPKNCG